MRRLLRTAVPLSAFLISIGGCGGVRQNTPFGWLALGPAPSTWSPAGTVSGGALPRPPGWRQERGDKGSVSFVELGHHGAVSGYLNATPRSGGERLENWTRFRPTHNAQEGDRQVRTLSGADELRVRTARASCVVDQYSTRLSAYRELACLIDDARGSTVVLGAAPPERWAAELPVIERAIAGFVAG